VLLVGGVERIERPRSHVFANRVATDLTFEERVNRLRGAVVGERDGLLEPSRHAVVERVADRSDGRQWEFDWRDARRQQAAVFQKPVTYAGQGAGGVPTGALPGAQKQGVGVRRLPREPARESHGCLRSWGRGNRKLCPP